MRQPTRWQRPALGLVIIVALAYVATFSHLALARHHHLMTHTADMGQIDLAVWNTLYGRFVQEVKGEQVSTRLTDHFEPVFWPVSAVFGAWDSAGALLVLQAAVFGLSALLIWGAVRVWSSTGDPRLAVAGATFAALTYLLAPQGQAVHAADFHASPLAVMPLALLLLLGHRRHTGPAWVAALAALAIKEEIALAVAVMSLALAVTRRWRAGYAIAAVAVLWFAVATFVVIPHYSASAYGEARMPYLTRYEDASGEGAPSGLIRGVLDRLGDSARWSYLLELLLAFGFMPLLAPEIAIAAAPLIAANVLSSYDAMYSGEFHYSAPFLSIWAVAAGVGFTRAWRWLRGARALRAVLILPVVLPPLGYAVLEGFAPLGREYYLHIPPPGSRTLPVSLARLVPAQAPLSVTPGLHPQFSHRERIYTFPAVADAEYVLLDVAGATDMHPHDVRQGYDDLLARGFGVVYGDDGFLALQRGVQAVTLPEGFASFAEAQVRPAHALAVDFGTSLRLEGYDWIDDPKWGYTSLRLYWRPLAPLRDNLAPYVLFVDADGATLLDTRDAPFVEPLWVPLSQWQPGHTYLTTTIPVSLGDAWGVYVGVTVDGQMDDPAARLVPAPGDGPAWPENLVRLAPVRRQVTGPLWEVVPWEEQPPVGQTTHQMGPFTLLGARWPAQAAVGAELPVTTYWSAATEADAPLTLSLRLMDDAGSVVASLDGPIQDGRRPPVTWAPGETVPDRKALQVPERLAPSLYTLGVVTYDGVTGAVFGDVGKPASLGQVRIVAAETSP